MYEEALIIAGYCVVSAILLYLNHTWSEKSRLAELLILVLALFLLIGGFAGKMLSVTAMVIFLVVGVAMLAMNKLWQYCQEKKAQRRDREVYLAVPPDVD